MCFYEYFSKLPDTINQKLSYKMKTNRRRFIRIACVTGTGMMAADMTGMSSVQSNKQSDPFASTKKISEEE